MIKVDISNVWGQLSLPDLLAVEKEVAEAHNTVANGTGPGNDFLGWLKLPVASETDEMRRIQAAADYIVQFKFVRYRPVIFPAHLFQSYQIMAAKLKELAGI
mgnify:CR=1 FL=1